MLNRHSLPVWMLADALLLICVTGGLLVFAAVSASTTRQTVHATRVRTQWEQKLRLVSEHERLAKEKSQEAERYRERAEEARRNMAVRNAELLESLQDAQSQIAQLTERVAREAGYRQEILQLRGDLSRTVFVIDTSLSMGTASSTPLSRPNWGQDGKPWTCVRNQVDMWLAHLPVQSFRVVCFNDQVTEFPPDDSSFVSGETWRAQAREFLASQKPRGITQTEKALLCALQSNPTAIILFTDGAPSSPTHNVDLAQQTRITNMLAKRKPRIPVNVIAVNDYFKKDLAQFLHAVAAGTGGGFIGF